MTDNDTSTEDLQSALAALDKAQAMMWLAPDGTILNANANFLKLSGYALEEIRGRHLHTLSDHGHSDPEKHARNIEKQFRGEMASSDIQRQTRHGRQYWVQATYLPIIDAEGKLSKYVELTTDVTPQKEKTLKRMSSVSEISASIANEAKAMTSTAGELSKRSESQAATVEETSAAMEEISATVNSNVKNAEQATEEARTARTQAEKGGEVVEKAIAAMEKIEDGSKQIRKFIEVIDSIAFQTNLLALNAGVEAARAGDAGRGFAVVASEVRALAQRASDSAKDINALIDTNGREVSEGAALVNETGSVLKDIMEGVAKVSDGIESIFTASREQAIGLDEINQAISQIDKSTQQNAAMAQESSASAATLVRNSTELQTLLGHESHSGQDRRQIEESKPASFIRRGASEFTQGFATHRGHKVAVNETPWTDEDEDDWTEF